MDALQDEVESLEAILMEDVTISRNKSGLPEIIETTIFPNVGDESEQQSTVCVTLQVLPTPGYPDSASPDFKLLRPRGLDDARLEAIKSSCCAKIAESLGFPVVFDLIEVVREALSDSGHLPSGQCVICLYGFSDGDEFTRTECFHYLHSYCLGRHLNALRRNYQEEYDKLPAWLQKNADAFCAACPVCREPIGDESNDSYKCAMPPAELQNAPDFRLTRELRELQQRMSSLFLQQKSRGAIIDVEAESGGAVISIETEADIRRRLQRKQLAEEAGECSSGGGGIGGLNLGVGGELDGSALTETGSARPGSFGGGGEQKDAAIGNAKASGSHAPFAPVVQQTQRISNDPTNNNYQHHSQQQQQQQHHNRRHYRGGRRHQHHHHPRGGERTERERERFEHHNHTSSSSGGGASHSSAAGNTAAAAVSNASGKQPKAQAAGSAHAR